MGNEVKGLEQNFTNKVIAKIVFLVGVAVLGLVASGKVSAAESSLSLTIDKSTTTVSISPTSSTGNFNKSGSTTVSASTDNATGYTLSIAAPNGAGVNYDKLINTSDSSAKLSSIPDSITEEQFKALNATAYNNMWGYLPSKYCTGNTSDTCSTNTSFLKAPTTTGDTLDITNSANSTANDYNLSIGARIDSSTKSGKYQNTFVVKLIGNAIPYSIVYDDNVVSNMPTDVSSTTPNSTVTIDSKVPVRAGYKFLGWCTVVPTSNNGTDTCTGGTQYQPSADLTIDQTGTGNNFHLYAMWRLNTIANAEYLQEVGACPASLATEQVYTLKDSRDNQTYKVAKLKDGKCWMVENLNLAGGTKLSSDTTDFESTYSLPTDQGWKSDGSLPDSSKSGFNKANYAYVYNSGNKENCGASDQNTPCYSYYSWDATTLGSGRTIATENEDAPYSICPKGWKLPTSRTTSATDWQTTSDFYQLAHQYGLDSTEATSESDDGFYTQAGPGTIPNFLLAGHYIYGSFDNGGSRGRYWSATSSSSTSVARYLYFNSSSVSSAGSDYRYDGFSVRCLLKSEQ